RRLLLALPANHGSFRGRDGRRRSSKSALPYLRLRAQIPQKQGRPQRDERAGSIPESSGKRERTSRRKRLAKEKIPIVSLGRSGALACPSTSSPSANPSRLLSSGADRAAGTPDGRSQPA